MINACERSFIACCSSDFLSLTAYGVKLPVTLFFSLFGFRFRESAIPLPGHTGGVLHRASKGCGAELAVAKR